MGTKTHPGKYDGHAKAEPHEPMFTLLARDPLADHLVRTWAALRSGNIAMAAYYFSQAAAVITKDVALDKLDEAMRCASAMYAYRNDLPYCRACLCTELHACDTPDGPCSWADPDMTVCTNPACRAAATAQTSTESSEATHGH